MDIKFRRSCYFLFLIVIRYFCFSFFVIVFIFGFGDDLVDFFGFDLGGVCIIFFYLYKKKKCWVENVLRKKMYFFINKVFKIILVVSCFFVIFL